MLVIVAVLGRPTGRASWSSGPSSSRELLSQVRVQGRFRRAGAPGGTFGSSYRVQSLVGDLAVILRRSRNGRVVLVVAAQAEPVPVGLRGGQGEGLAEFGVVGVRDVLRAGAVAVLALVALEVGRGVGRLPARVVLEAGRVAGDALGVEDRVRAWGRSRATRRRAACLVLAQRLIVLGWHVLHVSAPMNGRAGGALTESWRGKFSTTRWP